MHTQFYSELISIYNTEAAKVKQLNTATRLVTDSYWILKDTGLIPGETKRVLVKLFNQCVFFKQKVKKKTWIPRIELATLRRFMAKTNRCDTCYHSDIILIVLY